MRCRIKSGMTENNLLTCLPTNLLTLKSTPHPVFRFSANAQNRKQTSPSRGEVKKIAFTLAEVLITLGIIGIVAAMTIPTVITKHQKQVTATRLKQTYSQISQALIMAQVEYQSSGDWLINVSQEDDYTGTLQDIIQKFGDKYLAPFLKTSGHKGFYKLKDIGYSGWKSKAGDTYMGEYNTEYIIELTNGVTLIIYYNGNSNLKIFTTPIIFVDTNGKKGPNILGRDFFKFDVEQNMTLTTHGKGYNRAKLLELCAKNSVVYANLNCAALIMTDGWEIKDDYPW